MNAYCKKRHSWHANTKIGNCGLLKVARFIWDDDEDDTPSTTPSGTSGSRFTDAILKPGAEGSEVVVLQEALIALGYDVGKDGADGDFGANTEAAVKRFQSASGLLVDGEAGPDTKRAIEAALEKLTPQPQPDKNPATTAATVEITGGTVNVRTGPGKKFANAGIVRKGAKLVLLDTRGWFPIMHNGAVRWITGKYTHEAAPGILEVSGLTVNVRTGPGGNYPVVGIATRGQKYSVVDTAGWVSVIHDSCARWVSEKYAKK